MSIDAEPDLIEEEEYDEDADSDFKEDGGNRDETSSDSEEEKDKSHTSQKISVRTKSDPAAPPNDDTLELDSGDEATIKERKRAVRKQRKRGEDAHSDDDDDETAWRAKTRSMREREIDERKRSRLVNIKSSTIDVEKAWAEMNRPGPLPPIRSETVEEDAARPLKNHSTLMEQEGDEIPAPIVEEMITIKRKFKFAGEVHTEEKIVPASSAEARLWLAQQNTSSAPLKEGQIVSQRPLRKISRFDPNYNNLEAFRSNWIQSGQNTEPFKGPKLNVVEKSKMDWASHVDAAGLKDELDEHAKAKEGYHGRMDFLNEVEHRREEDARQARLKT